MDTIEHRDLVDIVKNLIRAFRWWSGIGHKCDACGQGLVFKCGVKQPAGYKQTTRGFQLSTNRYWCLDCECGNDDE